MRAVLDSPKGCPPDSLNVAREEIIAVGTMKKATLGMPGVAYFCFEDQAISC